MEKKSNFCFVLLIRPPLSLSFFPFHFLPEKLHPHSVPAFKLPLLLIYLNVILLFFNLQDVRNLKPIHPCRLSIPPDAYAILFWNDALHNLCASILVDEARKDLGDLGSTEIFKFQNVPQVLSCLITQYGSSSILHCIVPK